RVTPNDLTSLRLATGLLACAALVPGEPGWDWWAGWLWLASAFLDRADGELARITGTCTPGGHRYDLHVDNLVNSAIFVALGVGLGHSDPVMVAIGLATGAALFICGYWSEALERLQGPTAKAYSGAYGFDPDDALLLLAPLIWLGWKPQLLVASCVGATVMMLLTGWRLREAQRARE
ncbi:MAG: CDP-alcohol phosphatidyltransferase family protein, partial [Alphaproteobacteria bacterium]|nr:CDP-alcohol phosphatidyltransferase family protein [Alphaproteobacteria bacterium]